MASKIETDAAKVGAVALNIVDGKYVADAFVGIAKAVSVLGTVLSEQTELKSVLQTVVTDGGKLALQIGQVIVEKGDSWTDDAALLVSMKDFFTTDINTILIPVFEKIYGEIKTDIAGTPAVVA